MITVASIHLYPVKSARGVAVKQATCDDRGFAGDRRFLVVDPAGRFLTQREVPRLALIQAVRRGNRLGLAAPGRVPLTLPREAPDGVVCDVTIWRDAVRAVDLGEAAARWLSAYLDRPVRLVGAGAAFRRPLRHAAAQPEDEVAFQDQHPLLVLSEASLAELNGRLRDPVPLDRFRPNLVLRGTAPHAEDSWLRIRIGGTVLRAAGPCTRCVVTTTDQQTLARSAEPLRTLATYRRDRHGGVCFGQNYIHETKRGSIRVGQSVTVLA